MEITELQPGDLILVRGTAGIARVIEAVEHSPYSHVAGVVEGSTLVEAQGMRRTGTIDASAYVGCSDVYRFKYPLPIKRRDKIVELAKAAIGGRYDYLLILIELVRYLLHVTIRYKEPPNARICSVLWTSIYRKAGIDLCKGIRYPSPADVVASPYLKKVGSL